MKSIFNFILASYLFLCGLLISPLISSIVGSVQLEKELNNLLLNYNFVYEYIHGGVALGIGVGAILSLLSVAAMFFRVRFSNYTFIFGVVLFNFSILGNLNGVDVVTTPESALEALLNALEGAIIVLSLFRDDLGFTRAKPDL